MLVPKAVQISDLLLLPQAETCLRHDGSFHDLLFSICTGSNRLCILGAGLVDAFVLFFTNTDSFSKTTSGFGCSCTAESNIQSASGNGSTMICGSECIVGLGFGHLRINPCVCGWQHEL